MEQKSNKEITEELASSSSRPLLTGNKDYKTFSLIVVYNVLKQLKQNRHPFLGIFFRCFLGRVFHSFWLYSNGFLQQTGIDPPPNLCTRVQEGLL